MKCLAIVLAMLCAGEATALVVCPLSQSGRERWLNVPIVVTGNKQLRAIGFDLAFDKARLQFIGWSAGAIMRPWTFTGAQLVADSSRVRVGGFDILGTVLAGTDTLAVVSFEAVCGDAPTRYGTLNLVDDLQEAAPCESAAVVSCANALGRATWGRIKGLYR